MASLLSLALHGKLEYLTDIVRTLLSDLAAHYVHKNPKLMLRRSGPLSCTPLPTPAQSWGRQGQECPGGGLGQKPLGGK